MFPFWPYASILSISIDTIDLWFRFSSNLILYGGYVSQWYMLYVPRDMMMLHDAVNSGLRAVNSKYWLFEVGLAHWGVIQCSIPEALEKVERFRGAKHSSFWRHADRGGSTEAGVCRMWKTLGSETEWHLEQSLKCHFKLTDGASTVGVWGEYWSASEQQCEAQRFQITEVHSLECLR